MKTQQLRGNWENEENENGWMEEGEEWEYWVIEERCGDYRTLKERAQNRQMDMVDSVPTDLSMDR